MIQHVAIEVREADADACVRFWALLGFERVDPPAALAARAAWVRAGATTVHLLFVDEPAVPAEATSRSSSATTTATLAALRDAGFEPAPRTRVLGLATRVRALPGRASRRAHGVRAR